MTYGELKEAETYINAKENNWIWDEEFGGNLCPSCQEEIKRERKSSH